MQSLKGLSKGLLASGNDIKKATRSIPMTAYKYSRGRVLVLAESAEYRGAAVMAACAAENAIAALRTVSGFATVAAPTKLMPLLSAFSPTFVLQELKGNAEQRLKAISSVRHDSIVIGPGIKTTDIKLGYLEKIVALEKREGRAVIIDANVIGILKNKKKIINEKMVLTPHDGEFKTLSGVDLKGKGLNARISAACDFVTQHNCTLVLKGHETVITDGKRLKINVSKTPALATLGTGDVLAGMVASYAAQHSDLFESAVAAVHAHSIIGDMLFKKKGEHIIATDVIDAIPDVLKRFDVIRG